MAGAAGKNLRRKGGGKIKKVAETEDQLIVEIPLVVRVDPIGVEPRLAAVAAVDAEHVRVAVGVRYVQRFIFATVLGIFPGLYSIRHRNALKLCTKYLLFFSSHISLFA